MIRELFQPAPFRHEMVGTALCSPDELYKQERDWTCGVACIRTLASGIITVPSETLFISNNDLIPGSFGSKDFKSWEFGRRGFPILSDPRLDVRYGCDDAQRAELDCSDVWHWLRRGYRVALKLMTTFESGHWCVVLCYFPRAGVRSHDVVIYDPYHDEIRTIRSSELEMMWRNFGDVSSRHDYVLIRENPAVRV